MTAKTPDAIAFTRGESTSVTVILGGEKVSAEKTIGLDGPVYRTRQGIVLRGAKE